MKYPMEEFEICPFSSWEIFYKSCSAECLVLFHKYAPLQSYELMHILHRIDQIFYNKIDPLTLWNQQILTLANGAI